MSVNFKIFDKKRNIGANFKPILTKKTSIKKIKAGGEGGLKIEKILQLIYYGLKEKRLINLINKSLLLVIYI